MSTQQKIKDAALTLFSLHGYAGTTVGDIAKTVNIKTPSLYAHFSGKEELFITLVDDVLTNYTIYMKEAFTKTKGLLREERLYHYFKDFVAYFNSASSHSHFMKMMLLFPPSEFADKIKEKVAKVEQILIPYLIEVFQHDDHLPQDKLLDYVTAYFSFISGYVVGIVNLSPKLNQDRLIATWNIFWQGLKNNIEGEH